MTFCKTRTFDIPKTDGTKTSTLEISLFKEIVYSPIKRLINPISEFGDICKSDVVLRVTSSSAGSWNPAAYDSTHNPFGGVVGVSKNKAAPRISIAC